MSKKRFNPKWVALCGLLLSMMLVGVTSITLTRSPRRML